MIPHRPTLPWALALLACALFLPFLPAAESGASLPDPDGRPANMSRPVQVFILMGQSNMLGFGKISGGEGSLEHAVKEKGKYPYLVDEAGEWTVRKDVRNVRVMGSGTGNMRNFNNEWMTIGKGKVGPEIGIGHHLGHAIDAPVLILKSCIGNRSLGWDLLPPGSPRFEEDGMVYAGYKDSPDKWKKGEEPKRINWYAGMQYDGDTANAKKVLAELDRYYPGAKGYEIAGFFFWQGDKDRYNAAHARRYEHNLVRLIQALREDFKAPDAKFVCATLGQTAKGAGGNEGLILQGQMAVDGRSGKYPEFRGNVATVYSKPLCHGGASNGHYGGHAETYMDVGEAMGQAMVALLGAENALEKYEEILDSDSRPVYRALEKKRYATAWKALTKFEAALEAKKSGLDPEALARQKDLLEAFRGEILGPVNRAISELESLESSGDVYRLSVAYREHEKALGGIAPFDEATESTGKLLKDSATRSAISAGKKFHALIEKLRKVDSKRQEARSAGDTKSLQSVLERFASREEDNIYGRAAAIAAEKVADADHRIGTVASYLQEARKAG